MTGLLTGIGQGFQQGLDFWMTEEMARAKEERLLAIEENRYQRQKKDADARYQQGRADAQSDYERNRTDAQTDYTRNRTDAQTDQEAAWAHENDTWRERQAIKAKESETLELDVLIKRMNDPDIPDDEKAIYGEAVNKKISNNAGYSHLSVQTVDDPDTGGQKVYIIDKRDGSKIEAGSPSASERPAPGQVKMSKRLISQLESYIKNNPDQREAELEKWKRNLPHEPPPSFLTGRGVGASGSW
jgi:hypothetical protein